MVIFYLVKLSHQLYEQAIYRGYWLFAHILQNHVLQLFNELISLMCCKLERKIIPTRITSLLDNLSKDSTVLHSSKSNYLKL